MKIQVELFASGDCARCEQVNLQLKRIIEDIGNGRVTCRQILLPDEIDYAVALGVLATPSIAVDGELVFTSWPGAQRLRRTLLERLS